MIRPLAGLPRYIDPVSEPAGSVGTSSVTEPRRLPPGHAFARREWMPNCSSVQPSSPAAADGFMVMPGGSVILAFLRSEVSGSLEPSGCSTAASAVIPFGASEPLFSGVRWKVTAFPNGGIPSHSPVPTLEVKLPVA